MRKTTWQLLDDLNEKRRYCNLKEEALDGWHSLENYLYNRLQAFRETDFAMIV